jgi:hypothetical protein
MNFEGLLVATFCLGSILWSAPLQAQESDKLDLISLENQWSEISASFADDSLLRAFEISRSEIDDSRVRWRFYFQELPTAYEFQSKEWNCSLQNLEPPFCDEQEFLGRVERHREMPSRNRVDPLYSSVVFPAPLFWQGLLERIEQLPDDKLSSLDRLLPLRFWQDRHFMAAPLRIRMPDSSEDFSGYCHWHQDPDTSERIFDCHPTERPIDWFQNEIMFYSNSEEERP